jgi:uncharacterized protein
VTTYNTAERPDFVRKQYAFAAHIRNPEKNPRPDDIEARRMKIYRELFYNNVQGFMANTYPVLRQITSDECWHSIIRDYFANHLSHTPLFPEMPREFLKYLEHERKPQPDDPGFMLELAHYEWVELALSILDENIDASKINEQGDLLTGIPVMSPLAWMLSYHYPVHKISPEFQPETADDNQTHLVVYRDRFHEVHFMVLNPVTARLLQLIDEDNNRSGQLLLEQIASELNHPQPDIVISGGTQILHDLRKREVILGTTT